jgi:hypothetical protein
MRGYPAVIFYSYEFASDSLIPHRHINAREIVVLCIEADSRGHHDIIADLNKTGTSDVSEWSDVRVVADT